MEAEVQGADITCPKVLIAEASASGLTQELALITLFSAYSIPASRFGETLDLATPTCSWDSPAGWPVEEGLEKVLRLLCHVLESAHIPCSGQVPVGKLSRLPWITLICLIHVTFRRLRAFRDPGLTW